MITMFDTSDDSRVTKLKRNCPGIAYKYIHIYGYIQTYINMYLYAKFMCTSIHITKIVIATWL